jgi:hypothetical protein
MRTVNSREYRAKDMFTLLAGDKLSLQPVNMIEKVVGKVLRRRTRERKNFQKETKIQKRSDLHCILLSISSNQANGLRKPMRPKHENFSAKFATPQSFALYLHIEEQDGVFCLLLIVCLFMLTFLPKKQGGKPSLSKSCTFDAATDSK